MPPRERGHLTIYALREESAYPIIQTEQEIEWDVAYEPRERQLSLERDVREVIEGWNHGTGPEPGTYIAVVVEHDPVDRSILPKALLSFVVYEETVKHIRPGSA